MTINLECLRMISRILWNWGESSLLDKIARLSRRSIRVIQSNYLRTDQKQLLFLSFYDQKKTNSELLALK